MYELMRGHQGQTDDNKINEKIHCRQLRSSSRIQKVEVTERDKESKINKKSRKRKIPIDEKSVSVPKKRNKVVIQKGNSNSRRSKRLLAKQTIEDDDDDGGGGDLDEAIEVTHRHLSSKRQQRKDFEVQSYEQRKHRNASRPSSPAQGHDDNDNDPEDVLNDLVDVKYRQITGWPHLNECARTLEILNIGGTNVLGEFIPFLLLNLPEMQRLFPFKHFIAD